jgi:hypothetical protein
MSEWSDLKAIAYPYEWNIQCPKCDAVSVYSGRYLPETIQCCGEEFEVEVSPEI